MSRMVVVTLPEDQVTQLEFLAKEESNRIGKEVTMTDLSGAGCPSADQTDETKG